MVLQSNKTLAAKAITNDHSYMEFDLGSSFYYGLYLDYSTNYAAWGTVEMNAGDGYGGFTYSNSTGLVWNSNYGHTAAMTPYATISGNEFGGWIGKHSKSLFISSMAALARRGDSCLR